VQAAGRALLRENSWRMDARGQAKTVFNGGDGGGRGRLRQANRAGRRHRVHGGPDVGHAQEQPVGGRNGPGDVRVAARLENVPAVLRRRAERVPQRVRHGRRSARECSFRIF